MSLFIQQIDGNSFFEEFQLKTSNERYLSLVKHEKDRICTVSFADFETMTVTSIGTQLLFKSIESILYNIALDSWSPDIAPSVKQIIHTNITGHEFGKGIYKFLPLEISAANMDAIVNILGKFIEEDANPCFNYWSDIRVFLPFLELDYDDFRSMNLVFYHEPILKKAIVWYLTNHPDYEGFIKHHDQKIQSIVKSNPKEKVAVAAYTRFDEVMKRLEEREPLFEWDDNLLKPKYFTA